MAWVYYIYNLRKKKNHPAAATALTLTCGVLAVGLVDEGPTTADGVGWCEERWRSGSGSFFKPLVSTAAELCWLESTCGRHLLRIFLVVGIFASSSEKKVWLA